MAKETDLLFNLGCGTKPFENYTGFDLRPRIDNVIYHDVRDFSFLPDGCVEAIVAYDLFEHIKPLEADRVMAEWVRILKPGGQMILKMPDLKFQAVLYLKGEWNAEKFSKQILGSWDGHKPIGHKVAYDIDSITRILNRHGMRVVKSTTFKTPTTYNLVVMAEKERIEDD